MTRDNVVRGLLATLLGFIALNAFGGGGYGLAGAEGVPLEWLEGSPFSTYVVPSLILLVVVGGACAAAAVAVAVGARRSRAAAIGAGLICFVWIAVQLAIIGYVSWMQPAVAMASAVIVLLARAGSAPPGRHRADPAHVLLCLLFLGCGDPEASDPANEPDPASRRIDVDCVLDTDCVLMPFVTCCGECPPAPPFEAAPREALDAVLIESEQRCALDRRPCKPPVCDPVPAGCWAKATCEANRCVVRTDGCRL